MVRMDSLDGFFAAVSCFGGKLVTHAYVSAKGHGKYMDILGKAIDEWNNGTITIYKEKDRVPYDRQSDPDESRIKEIINE